MLIGKRTESHPMACQSPGNARCQDLLRIPVSREQRFWYGENTDTGGMNVDSGC